MYCVEEMHTFVQGTDIYIDISDIDDIDVYILPPKFKKLSLFFLAQKREHVVRCKILYNKVCVHTRHVCRSTFTLFSNFALS